nr:MAG TPA: hypothetical protein [Caudoviricetes sp.]
MATPFADIYSRAIFRFADYKFLEQDIDTREAVLEQYLFSAKTEFQKVCKVDLSHYDRELQQFDVDLGDEEIEILSLGIAYYWLSARTLNSENLKNRLNSKDYYYYSPANLLKEIQTLRKTVRDEFYSRMRQYSYLDNSIGTLKN